MPYPNEHSCRLEDPAKYDKFSRKDCEQKHDGKCIDVIYGIKAGKSEVQALRYKTDIWSESSARAHCESREGSFEPASEKENAMEIEHKSFTGIELKADKPGEFTARFATLNVVDKDGDVTLPGAAPAGKEILISAYMHGSWMGELPVGKGVIAEKGEELLVEGQFNLNTESGKEHYEALKFAPGLQEWSYGFRVLELDEESEWNENPKVNRVFKSLDIFEVSPVLRGAGVNTALLSIKTEQGKTFADQSEAVLAAVEDMVIRAKSLADLRRSEGRDLSERNRERLDGLGKKLGEISGELGRLLKAEEVTVDGPAENEATGVYLEFLKIHEMRGVLK